MQDTCLFAHYDRGGRVDEYVLRYLGEIKAANFAIVFISTATLSGADIERLGTDCVDVILRENRGLDFGSWSVGFAKHHAAINGRLLLANDSVYGPIGNLATALDRLTRAPADFYGMVESIEIAPHLQSWFLLFEPWVVRHDALKAVLGQQFFAMTKKQIIENGEIGVSRRLVDAGYRYHALHLTDRAGLAARFCSVNPMHMLWRELLFEEGIPFLKIELLRDNPTGVEDAATILREIEPLAPGICRQIKLHLARTAGKELRRKPPKTAAERWIKSSRLVLVRNGYRLHGEKRRMAEALNFIGLQGLQWLILAVHGVRSMQQRLSRRRYSFPERP